MPAHPGVAIRAAIPADAEALTAIAFAAKRHWGYSEHLIELWSKGLTISDRYILEHTVFVAEINSIPVGVCALEFMGRDVEMTHLWVQPGQMGRGIGRQLFEHAVDDLQMRRVSRLVILSDPHAEGFYLRLGARRIGEVASTPEGRMLPQLDYALHVGSSPERE